MDNNSSLLCDSFEPYGLCISMTDLNLEKYFYKIDADNVNSVRTYLRKNGMDIYGIFWTARDILLNQKNHNTIDLMVVSSQEKVKNLLHGSGLLKEYFGPSFTYIKKSKLHTYQVFFNIKNTFSGENLMADLFIKVKSPFWLKTSNTIELRFINEDCFF